MGLLLQASLPSPSPPKTTSTTTPTPLAPRPAIILPGLGNNSKDYNGLVSTLETFGIKTVVADVSRVDWLRNAAGLLDANYWRGTLQPRPVLDWYLKRVEDAVANAKQLQQGDQKLSMIGHSAGGWLARVFLEEFGPCDISLLLTLGSPHLPPPKGLAGVIDQTRGLLDYVEKNCRPAVYSPELKYVCIAGRYIQGSKLIGKSDQALSDQNTDNSETGTIEHTSSEAPTLRSRLVGQGYKQVCGQAVVWGDGVVPAESAHLEGALNLSFDGVYHSPVGSNDSERPWYGSPAIVGKWVHHLL